ncbi:MAG: carboxypeptidase regulatory-like domain-containing protein [Thermoanaerobaculia bacterium]
MLEHPLRPPKGPGAPGLLLLVLPLALAAPPAAIQAGPPEAGPPDAPAGEAPPAARAARELGRLDARLGLDTFEDGSGLWTARLAAALDLRLRSADTTGAPLADLMRRLATQLRGLGVEQPLLEPPGIPAEELEPPGPERAERLRRVVATVRLLHDKLDRLERPRPEGDRLTTRAAPGNDACTAATSIGEGTFTGSTAEATVDGSSTCGDTSSSPDVWFRYTAADAGQVTFDTFGSSYDTVLSLHTGCPAEGRDVELACNDDSGGTLQSSVTLDMATGEEVWVRVSGSSGASGSFELNVEHFQGLAGTITREDTGGALSEATVSLFDDFGFLVDDRVTGADGSYAFDSLTDGTYYVRAEADGMIDELYDDVPCPFFTFCDPSFDGTPVDLTGAATGIDLALEPGNTISGTVTDAGTGDPVSAFLELYSETGSFLHSVAADADGAYEIGGLPAGTYHLVAGASTHRDELYDDLPCQGSCDVTAGAPLEVSGGVTLSGIDFALERLGAIEGTLVEEGTGDPLGGQRVVGFDSSGSVGSDFTDADGDYRIGSLEAGDHFVRTDTFGFQDELYDDLPCVGACDVTTGTPVPVDFDTTTDGIDFALLRLGEIQGTVTHTVSGDPVASVLVRVFNDSGFSVRSTFTGSDGTFVLDRLESGSYTVATDADLYRNEVYDDVPCDGVCDPSVGTPVEASAGTTTAGIDFALDRLGRIQGRVLQAGSDLPLASGVVALDASGSSVRSTQSSSVGGDYLLQGLPQGTYFVKTTFFDSFDFAHQDELYDDVPCEPSCDLSEGVALPVVLNGTVLGADFALAPCPADSFADIRTTLYLSTHAEEACERITAGTDTTVASGADVTFKAGRAVVLEDGFAVQDGAGFRVVMEPDWTDD